jgi:DNA-binding IclR family transcriptional regulator
VRNTSALESVDNALRLLLLLGDRDQVRVSDVSQELGLALSTSHRLLATLKQRDFVEQQSDRSYVRGPAFARVFADATPTRSVNDVALPHLEKLRSTVNETTHLATLDGTNVKILLSVESTQSLRVTSRSGVVMPAHQTSAGKALLAELPPDLLEERYPTAGSADLGLDAKDIARLRRELAGVRRHGYGLNKAESERGLAAIGVAVHGPERFPKWAISISVPTVRLNTARLREMTESLIRAGADLEADLAA